MNRNYCDVETHTVVLFQAVAFPMVGALFLTSLDLWKSSKGRHHRRESSDCPSRRMHQERTRTTLF